MAPGTLPRELEEMTSLPTSVILRTPYTVVRLTLSWRSVSVLPEAAQKTIARTAAEVLLPQIIFISYRPGMVQLWTPWLQHIHTWIHFTQYMCTLKLLPGSTVRCTIQASDRYTKTRLKIILIEVGVALVSLLFVAVHCPPWRRSAFYRFIVIELSKNFRCDTIVPLSNDAIESFDTISNTKN